MKKINKLILTMLAVFAITIVMKMPVSANSSIRQVSCTSTQAVITWDNPYLSSSSTLLGFTLKRTDGTPIATYGPTVRSATLTAKASTEENLYMYYTYRSSYGSTYEGYIGLVTVNTLPMAADKKYVAIESVLSSSKKISFKVVKPDVNGFELQLYKGSKLVQKFEGSRYSTTTNYMPFGSNATYYYRIRYTYKNYDNGQTYYGPWSGKKAFAHPDFKISFKGKTVKVTLKKAAGVSKYNIYVSKKSSTSGYKKAATVSLGKKSKKTITLKKKYYTTKLWKDNYVKVVPVISKFGNSPVSAYKGFYFKRVYR